MRLHILVFLALLLSANLGAQTLTDNFADGDFTNNPTWLGDDAEFTVATGLLRNNSTVTANSYLSTAATLRDTATWEFVVRQDFAPSTSNYTKIYLASDQSNLEGSLNGFFVRVGGMTGATDSIELRRQTGTTTVKILGGTNGAVGTNHIVRIRVTRSRAGVWSMSVDYAGGTNFVAQGSALDATALSSSFFGIAAIYTSTNGQKIFLDDVNVGPLFSDTTPPTALDGGAYQGNPNRLFVLMSEPILANSVVSLSNYTFPITISSAQVDPNNPSQILLDLASPMQSGAFYTLQVIGIQDLAGNGLSAPATFNFQYVLLEAPQVGDLLINEILADPNGAQMPCEYLEIANFSNKYLNLNGVVLREGTTDRVLSSTDLRMDPGAKLVIFDNSFVASVTTAGIGVGSQLPLSLSSSWLTNGGEQLQLKNAAGTILSDVTYSSTWYPTGSAAGKSLELINPAQVCKGRANWAVSTATIGHTAGAQNSVFSNTPDVTGPAIQTANYLDANTVVLSFDDVLNVAFAGNGLNYTFQPGRGVTAVNVLGNQVTLTLSRPLDNQTAYTVTAANIYDCVGNVISANTTATFFYLELEVPVLGDLYINEILADPTGSGIYEYVEIWNKSNKFLDLNGVVLRESTSDRVLATAPKTMGPGEHFVIFDDDFVADFTSAGIPTSRQLPLLLSSSWLTNGGEALTLRNAAGAILHEVTYDDAWYNGVSGVGRSLELKNADLICKGAQNWAASTDVSGHTAARRNSVFSNVADVTGPALLAAQQVDATHILLTFDDVLNANTLSGISLVAPSIAVTAASIADDLSQTVLLTLGQSLTNGVTVTVRASGVRDCVGNSIGSQNTVTFVYYETQPAERYDVIINEIYCDINPLRALQPLQYIELYNRSNKVINLQGWQLADGSSTRATLPLKLMQPGTYLLLYRNNPTINYTADGDGLQLSPIPDFNVGGDDVMLFDNAGETIDALTYDQRWYQNTDKSEGGWSLERINTDQPCLGAENWTASNDVRGGTPGARNSVYDTQLMYPLLRALRAFPVAPDTVRLFFNRALSEDEATEVSHYHFFNSATSAASFLQVTDARLEPPFFNTVVLTLNAAIPFDTIYNIVVADHLQDCIGNGLGADATVRVARYTRPNKGDLLINEVLFNPVTGGSDFVEVFNKSQKTFNTGSLTLGNTDEFGALDATRNIGTSVLIFPGDHFAIGPDMVQVVEQYRVEDARLPLLLESALPTYDDSEGGVVLLSGSTIVDSFAYSKNLHTPLLDDENGVSLERIRYDAPTNDADNWHSASTASGYATPGKVNSSSLNGSSFAGELLELSASTLSPDGDGYQDFLSITPATGAVGYVANIKIFDAQGLQVKTLARSELLGPSGTYIQWDGTSDDGKKAPIGIYLIQAELFKANGETLNVVKEVVLAGR